MKRQRQAAIIEIIRNKEVKNQSEMVKELNLRGYKVTQSTVSRDIKELVLVKGRGSGGILCYREPGGEGVEGIESSLRRIASEFLLTAEASGNIVVVRTSPGHAQGLAAAIDGAVLDGVVGTVAGDDTIMIVCSLAIDSVEIKKRLLSIVKAA